MYISNFAFNFILIFFSFLNTLIVCDVCVCYILALLFNSQLLVGYIDQFIDRNMQ